MPLRSSTQTILCGPGPGTPGCLLRDQSASAGLSSYPTMRMRVWRRALGEQGLGGKPSSLGHTHAVLRLSLQLLCAAAIVCAGPLPTCQAVHAGYSTPLEDTTVHSIPGPPLGVSPKPHSLEVYMNCVTQGQLDAESQYRHVSREVTVKSIHKQVHATHALTWSTTPLRLVWLRSWAAALGTVLHALPAASPCGAIVLPHSSC